MISSLVGSTDAGSIDQHLDFLREHPSATLPPSPLSPSSYGRPRAPTPSAFDEHWSPPVESPTITATTLSALYTPDSPLTDAHHSPPSFARPPKPVMPLPDPSHFPDPYPFRPPHHHLNSLPALSSAGSSSTRSSAYTSSGSALASGDYGHIHVATGEEDAAPGVSITSDAVVQMLANDPSSSSSARGIQSRAPPDQSRWSESYSAGARSRSSSISNNNATIALDIVAPKLQQKPSYDMGWQSVDEKDEVGMSEEETDDDHHLGDEEEDEKEEERTSAVVIAEEGRGLIVQGDNVPIVQLQVPPGMSIFPT